MCLNLSEKMDWLSVSKTIYQDDDDDYLVSKLLTAVFLQLSKPLFSTLRVLF